MISDNVQILFPFLNLLGGPRKGNRIFLFPLFISQQQCAFRIQTQPSINTRVQLQLEINGLCTLALEPICCDNSLGGLLGSHLPIQPYSQCFSHHEASFYSLNRPTCSYLSAFAFAAPSAKKSLLLESLSHLSSLRIHSTSSDGLSLTQNNVVPPATFKTHIQLSILLLIPLPISLCPQHLSPSEMLSCSFFLAF